MYLQNLHIYEIIYTFVYVCINISSQSHLFIFLQHLLKNRGFTFDRSDLPIFSSIVFLFPKKSLPTLRSQIFSDNFFYKFCGFSLYVQDYKLFQINLCVQCETDTEMHFFTNKYPIVSATFVEKTTLSSTELHLTLW